MPYSQSNYCVGAIGSMTAALKASQVLKSRGLRVEVIGLSATETKRGCAYGISFDCGIMNEVRTALKQGGIAVSQYLQRRGAP